MGGRQVTGWVKADSAPATFGMPHVLTTNGKPCSSFFPQTAEGWFYPDFVCRLPDETILVVEYKGANLYQSAKINRDIGGLWAEMSDGK